MGFEVQFVVNVNTQVFERIDQFHGRSVDKQRAVELAGCSEVHAQFFGFGHAELEEIVIAPLGQLRHRVDVLLEGAGLAQTDHDCCVIGRGCGAVVSVLASRSRGYWFEARARPRYFPCVLG